MKKDYKDTQYKYTNREKAHMPRLGKSWCDTCDRDMVGVGAKCHTCGASDGNKNFKK